MTESLLLRLQTPSPDAQVEACLWTSARRGVAPLARPLGSMPLSEAAARAQGRRVIVVLPAADVLTLSLALPDAPPAKLRASLPFALEDQVAGDIDAQHCALGAREDDGRWAVRVIARERLSAWLSLLRMNGIEPEAVVSAAEGLRDKPGDVMLWLDGSDTHWRAPGGTTVTLPTDGAWETGLAAALGERAGSLLGLVVHATTEDRQRHEAAIEGLRGHVAQLRWMPLPEGALAAFADRYDDAVNLLQGPFAPRRAKTDVGANAWRWPLRLAAAAVALQAVAFGLEAWRLERLQTATDAALLAAAQPLQPGIADPAAASALLRSRVADWSRAEDIAGSGPLPLALDQLAQSKAASPTLQLVALALEADGRVRADLSAADAPALEAATRTLAAAGWTPSDAGEAVTAVPGGPAADVEVVRWRSAPRSAPAPDSTTERGR